MDDTPYCSYYGTLHGKLLGSPLGVDMVDELFKKMLVKYREQLKKDILNLKKEFQESVCNDIKLLKKMLMDHREEDCKEIKSLQIRVTQLELDNKKVKKKVTK